MLVQFSVRNVLSFKDQVTLDMTAISVYKEHPYKLINIGTKENYLHVASIYGANASGKSNLIYAMKYFQRIVKDSINNEDDPSQTVIARLFKPFLFTEKKDTSEFEIVEIFDGYEYSYGFEYNAECIVSEWLYRKKLTTNRKTIVFERHHSEMSFGASVRKECDIYKGTIPSDTLVLSFFNKLKMKTNVFTDVYDSISSTLVLDSDFGDYNLMIRGQLPSVIDTQKEKLMQFLSAIDTGICDIYYEKIENRLFFFTKHKDSEGNEYSSELYNESAGTIKSIDCFIFAQAAVMMNKSLFIDELNIKLHPLLLKFIVDLFYEKDTTAQLIYTTHDTTLMDRKFFRRDQIWFVQKNQGGCSDLCALSDYKVRSDASFEKDYLAGVYGGIPLLKEFQLKGDSDNGNG